MACPLDFLRCARSVEKAKAQAEKEKKRESMIEMDDGNDEDKEEEEDEEATGDDDWNDHGQELRAHTKRPEALMYLEFINGIYSGLWDGCIRTTVNIDFQCGKGGLTGIGESLMDDKSKGGDLAKQVKTLMRKLERPQVISCGSDPIAPSDAVRRLARSASDPEGDTSTETERGSCWTQVQSLRKKYIHFINAKHLSRRNRQCLRSSARITN